MSSDLTFISRLLAKLYAVFKIRDLCTPSFFLGIETIRTHDGLLLSQYHYTSDIMKRVGIVDGKPLDMPIHVNKSAKLSTEPFNDPTKYHSLAGSLQYLTVTRPDLSYAVNQLCQHMHSPTVAHWSHLKWVFRYVKDTLHFGLHLCESSTSNLHVFSDSDWAGCPLDRKSTSGFAVFLGSNLVSWVCKKQRTVAHSFTEAEYKALADASAKVTWIVSLLRELGFISLSVPKSWYWCYIHVC